MGFDLDDEILLDFLTEAGEILEQLGEQLVELEQNPNDPDLLNAVFRGFHTVKGGAGFLNIEPLVQVCHRAEDIFNVLRQGELQIDPHLMDNILQVLDIVNAMFDAIKVSEEPIAAEPALLHELERIAKGEHLIEQGSTTSATPAVVSDDNIEIFDNLLDVVQGVTNTTTAPASTDSDDISDDEFDNLLDQIHGTGGAPGADGASNKNTVTPTISTASSNNDSIDEDEFDALLDQLHGAGAAPGKSKDSQPPTTTATTEPLSDSDDITEDEFDALLDQLHSKQSAPSAPSEPEAPEPQASKSESEDISEEEFESILDQLHTPGSPPPPTPAPAPAPIAETKPEPIATTKSEPEPEPEPVKATPPKPVAKPSAQDKTQATPAETTVRVDTKRLDDIMNMVGELVLVRNRLDTLKASMQDEKVAKAIANLDVVTADLQLAVMKTRMQPIKKVFGRFPRVVRDLARNLKKEVQLEMQGEETDLDKNLVEALADPLVHLVRNAVDHGIETPQERVAIGKPRKGTVILAAAQEGDHILLSIEDDGKGMNAESLRKIAVEKGLMDEESAERMDEHECYNLIFMPGFSTKVEISDVSGRGVGMDVVKTRIIQMNGTVEIDSVEGKGSRIIIKVPLTLAIMPTLMVQLGKQIFALPLASVVEIFNLDLKKTNVVDGQLTILVRDRALPLFYLREWLALRGMGDASKEQGHVVVVNAGRQRVCFVVDHLIGQEEVVIKPLGALLHGLQGMAGATITGDGKISLILDVPGIMKKYA